MLPCWPADPRSPGQRGLCLELGDESVESGRYKGVNGKRERLRLRETGRRGTWLLPGWTHPVPSWHSPNRVKSQGNPLLSSGLHTKAAEGITRLRQLDFRLLMSHHVRPAIAACPALPAAL